MIKNWKITSAFFIGSIIIAILWCNFFGEINTNKQNSAQILGSIIGSTMVIYFAPLIIIYLIKLISLLFKKNLVGNQFLKAYSIVWGILIFMLIKGALIGKLNEPSFSKKVDISKSYYLYSPKKSEYSVVFFKKPKVYAVTAPFGSYFLEGEIAEIDSPNYGDFERVEFYLLNEKFLDLINKEVAFNFLNLWCQNNGLSYPEIKFHENDMEKYAELRAFKDITTAKNGEKVKGTFMAKVYIKGSTFFVTYVASKSTEFPTIEIERFWSSIKQSQPNKY